MTSQMRSLGRMGWRVGTVNTVLTWTAKLRMAQKNTSRRSLRIRTNMAATMRPGRGSWRSEVSLTIPPEEPNQVGDLKGGLDGATNFGRVESTAEGPGGWAEVVDWTEWRDGCLLPSTPAASSWISSSIINRNMRKISSYCHYWRLKDS